MRVASGGCASAARTLASRQRLAMATRGMLVRRLDRRSLFLCTRSSCPCCTSGSPSPVHTSGTRPPVCVFSGGGVLADQWCPIARLCAPCVCEGVCAQCTATIRTKRARWFPGKEGHVRGGDPGRAPRPSRLHRGAVGARCPYASTWPSLLVHLPVMHTPCQPGATASQARNLWWCKALHTAGDCRQGPPAHVPLPSGGHDANG